MKQTVIPRKIDHIVYAVPNFKKAIAEFEQLTSVKPIFGGYHVSHGTKNALVNLGQGSYLEIIAVDNENKHVSPPRWMGVDFLSKPQVTRWALKSDDLKSDAAILKRYHNKMGELHEGTRKTLSHQTLSWQMVLPLASPEVELIPFMVDWQLTENHPTDVLPKACCKLLDIKATHPQPNEISPVLNLLGLSLPLLKNESISMQITMETPSGIVSL